MGVVLKKEAELVFESCFFFTITILIWILIKVSFMVQFLC